MGSSYRLLWRQGVTVVIPVLMIGTLFMQGTNGKNIDKNHSSLQMQNDVISISHIGTQQDSQSNEWDRVFGGSEIDCGRSVRQTTDGGYIVTGYTNYTEMGTGDIWLIKTDAHGQEQWNKTYGGENGDFGYSVQQTMDGGYIVAGTVNVYCDMILRSSVGLIKTDQQGNVIWSKKFRGEGFSGGRSVLQAADKGFIVLGWTAKNYLSASDVLVIKTDANGTEQWNRTFGGTKYYFAESIDYAADNGYIITGWTAQGSDSDIWLLKINDNGTEQWNRTFYGSLDEIGCSIQHTNDGGYIIVGCTNYYGSVLSDALLIKTNANGIEEWNKTYGGSYNDEGISVRQTTDGGYVFTGDTTTQKNGSSDLWVVKTDAQGTELWNRSISSEKGGSGSSIQQTNDGMFIITGVIVSPSTDNLDVWLVKIADAPEAKKKTAFIIGTLSDLDTDGVFITFQAQNLWYVQMLPPSIIHYKTGDYITMLQQHAGILRPRAVCGFFKTRIQTKVVSVTD